MYACLYIQAFPAWVFERVEPDTGPVAVVASGEVVACSRKLRAAGIVEGIRVDRAERLFPEGMRIRRRDAPLEQAVWEDVLHQIHMHTPFLEPDRPGRAYFKPFDGIRELVSKLHAQAAVAPFRATALLGALRAAEGNVLAIRNMRAFLDRFETARLAELDFSEEILEQLPLFGFDTLGAAFGLEYRHLKAQFGKEGERFYHLLHPGKEEAVSLYKPPPAISRAYEFELPCSEPGEVLPALEFITRQAAGELKDHGAQRVKLMLHDRLRPSAFACRVLPEPSNDPRRLFNTIKTLLGGMLGPESRIQAVEVELASMRTMGGTQGSLFFQRPTAAKAVKAIHRRYPDAIRRPVTEPHAVFEEERARLEGIGDRG